MSPSRFRLILWTLVFFLIAGAFARPAEPRVPSKAGADSGDRVPAPALPLPGDRLSESIARFVVTPGGGARDLHIVVARVPFDPTGWTSLPAGPAWWVLPYGASPVVMGPLGLAEGTDTPLWWAVTWTDAETGALRASAARTFTLVPRFANRAAPDGAVPMSATGRLPAPPPTGSGAPRRSIELAAGYSLVPDGPAPVLPASLLRAARSAAESRGRGAYIVQFADGSADSARARIEGAGGTIVTPLAGGYLVRMETDARARLAGQGGQPWIASYEPAYKLSPALDPAATGRVDVTALLFADSNDDATAAALRSLGAINLRSHRGDLNHLARFELDRARLAEVAALADVAWIEPSPRDTLLNDQAQWVLQSNIEDSRPVWARGLRGQGQVVMTSDTGIRTNHEMFDDTTLAITGWGDFPAHRKIIAYKPASQDPEVSFGDEVLFDYHGTHTGGTVAGSPGPYSTAPWSGMAKDARLYFMDLSGPVGGGLHPPADLNDLFLPSYLGNAGGAARISSNSWGSYTVARYSISSMQVDQFMWHHPDYLIAFSSGNVGAFATVHSPGTAKNCLTIGATGNGSMANDLANFSSRGPTADGRRKPTLVAPGDLVTSSVGSTRYSYGTYSGTSMATPASVGALALARQYLIEGWYPTGAPVAANAIDPSAALLKAIAMAGSRNDVTTFRVPDNSIGYGRLTLDDVLHFPGDAGRTLLIDSNDGLHDLQYVEYQVQVTNPVQPLKIVLCWTDAPGHPASQVQIVNDLDLLVTHGGSTYRGNYLLNYVSVAGGTRDSLNVEELVRIPAPEAGLWTVRVEARRVAQGPQRFALCLTGGVGGPVGAVALDRFQYALNDTIAIEVLDDNATSPLAVTMSSSTEPWGAPVLLTGGNGVFRGVTPIAPITARLHDGVLSVSSDDVVTVTYAGVSPATTLSATARVNVQTPVITNVHATALSGAQALITWTTDLAATTRVRYGATLPITSVADSSGFTTQHAVLLTGLAPGAHYRYDVESASGTGATSRDSLGGAHRSFTTQAPGDIALLMDDPSSTVAATWTNALQALGWNVDVLVGSALDPPLVGNASAGLRRYNAVLWQVDPNRYPAFSDAQRMAIDSLLNGGGRLLVTGHDIGFSLADAGAPSYSPERETWLESGLKSRYYYDIYAADTLAGLADDPISSPWIGGTLYHEYLYPDAGDLAIPAPGTNGVGVSNWFGDGLPGVPMGLRWESHAPQGVPGSGVWGGQRSRLVCMFFEWPAIATTAVGHSAVRTGILERSVEWLLGRHPPLLTLNAPLPGAIVSGDFLPIRYSILPHPGRSISSRSLDYSLDGGETWNLLHTTAGGDSGWIWDLGAALGGDPIPNSTRVQLRVRVVDDGQPPLRSEAVMAGTFTLARPTGDMQGPVLVAGTAGTSPSPVVATRPATLYATLSDAETGAGFVEAAEYSIGAAPAPPGGGTPMSGTFGAITAEVSVPLTEFGSSPGTHSLWVRGRDAAANWGPAAGFSVIVNADGTVAVESSPLLDFLATASPNPVRGSTSVRFGLARAGDVRLELFDLAGRRVSTLASGTMAAGPHAAVWNRQDQRGHRVGAGVYFIRLLTPTQAFHSRVVVLD